jgi:type I restriction enzyme S subunit
MTEAIPSSWLSQRLGDVVTLSRGIDLPVQNRSEGVCPVVGSNGVVGYHSSSAVQGPGVLVGRSGSVGEVAYIEEDYWPLNTTLYVKDFRGNYPRFISYFLRHLDLGRFTGGVSVPTLNRNILHKLEVWLPPVSEQRAIASVLHAVQRAKEARQRELALECERKDALMEHLFTHGTCGEATKPTPIGEVPESWSLATLESLYETQLGKMLSQKAHTGVNAKPYLRNANVQWGTVNVTDLYEMDFNEAEQEKFLLKEGDLLICEGGEIGRSAIWKAELPECYFQKAIHRARPRSTDVVPEFLRYWMEWGFRVADVYGVTGTQTTIAHLPQEKLAQMRIPNPQKSVQKEMAAAFSACDTVIRTVQKEITLLDELFAALLQELMTGELRCDALLGGVTIQ